MAIAFTYGQAIEAGCFFQLPLFGADALRKAAAARGLLDFPHAVDWEPLDREGLVPPVAYARQPLTAELHLPALGAGDLILRDDRGYADWRENEFFPLYAHWQLLSLAELHESLRGRSPLVMLAGGTAQLSEELGRRARWLKDSGFSGRVAGGHRDLELLLARTQSLFMPVVRGSYRVGAIFDRDGERLDLDAREWAVRERSQLNYEQAARECGVRWSGLPGGTAAASSNSPSVGNGGSANAGVVGDGVAAPLGEDAMRASGLAAPADPAGGRLEIARDLLGNCAMPASVLTPRKSASAGAILAR